MKDLLEDIANLKITEAIRTIDVCYEVGFENLS